MPDVARSDVQRYSAYAVGAVLVASALWLAADAGSAAPGSSAASIAVDLAVGLAYVLAAIFASGSQLMRGIVFSVGLSWLLGSWLPGAALWHQGLLVIALAVFPTGRPSNPSRWMLVLAALPVAFGVGGQLAAAATLAAVAALSSVDARHDSRAGWYPILSAMAIAIILAASWSISRFRAEAFEPLLALLTYQVALIFVAIALPFAIRAVNGRRDHLAELVLGNEGLSGLEGFATVLGETLGDDSLRVYLWGGTDTGYIAEGAVAMADGADDSRWFEVFDGGERIAAVVHRSPALEDSSTADAVASAVRLAVRHLELVIGLRTQLQELEAARSRIVAAVDRQRETTASLLRQDVVASLRRATSELAPTLGDRHDKGSTEALRIAVEEVRLAQQELVALVAGVPSAPMGNGGIHAAIGALAEGCPIPVSVSVSPDAIAGTAVETTLFY
ncbi:MAG TPA: hypothetical protein VFT54_09570, partial [Acidimicrobiia bacterium]|nr:hypothetical protein [Acidimicrobiia bacterium]